MIWNFLKIVLKKKFLPHDQEEKHVSCPASLRVLVNNFNAWFTFSLRQHETRRECEGYIHLVFLTLDLFSSRLEALRDMSVNQFRVKGNENISTLSCSFRTRVWMSTFVRTLSRSHLAKSLDEYPRWECKPGIRNLKCERTCAAHARWYSVLCLRLWLAKQWKNSRVGHKKPVVK